ARPSPRYRDGWDKRRSRPRPPGTRHARRPDSRLEALHARRHLIDLISFVRLRHSYFNLLRLSDGYNLSLGHHLPLSNGDAPAGYDGIGNTLLAFFPFDPRDVLFGIFLPMLPRTVVVLELQLIHHHDALFHRTDLGAFAATNAVLVVDVVVAVAGRIEAFIRTLNPAKRALSAEIEPHRRPLGLGSAAFEHGVSRLSPRADFESAFDCRNRGALLHLEPLGQHGYLMRPHDSVVRCNRLHPWRVG